MRNALVLSLAVAAVAATSAFGAVAPKTGAYAGNTTEKQVNGFPPTASFTVGSKGLATFTFRTLGCFSAGEFPAGVDPFSTSMVILTASIPVKAGAFTATKAAGTFTFDKTIKTVSNITGTFTNATTATGVITYTQTDSYKDVCGPTKVKFTAVLGGNPTPTG
jgi:hypothetical protein